MRHDEAKYREIFTNFYKIINDVLVAAFIESDLQNIEIAVNFSGKQFYMTNLFNSHKIINNETIKNINYEINNWKSDNNSLINWERLKRFPGDLLMRSIFDEALGLVIVSREKINISNQERHNSLDDALDFSHILPEEYNSKTILNIIENNYKISTDKIKLEKISKIDDKENKQNNYKI